MVNKGISKEKTNEMFFMLVNIFTPGSEITPYGGQKGTKRYFRTEKNGYNVEYQPDRNECIVRYGKEKLFELFVPITPRNSYRMFTREKFINSLIVSNNLRSRIQKTGEIRTTGDMKYNCVLPEEEMAEVCTAYKKMSDMRAVNGTTNEQQAEKRDNMERHYFWLNANTNYWCVHNTPVGIEEGHTLYNDNGNKRYVFRCFTDARIGDIAISFQGHPNRLILAIYKITKQAENPNDLNEEVGFTKIVDIPNGVTKEELIENGLQDAKPIKGNQGTLFPLSKDEFTRIVEIIERKNPSLLKADGHNLSLAERIEKLTIEEAVAYSKQQGTYLLGRNFPIGKSYTTKELMEEIQVSKLDSIIRSKRDNTCIIIDYVDSGIISWESNGHFSLYNKQSFDKEFEYNWDLSLDLGVEKYVFVFCENEDQTFIYVGIAQLVITNVDNMINSEGKYEYTIKIEDRKSVV